jgi:cell wall-associated NlpC family hydrolase
VIHLPRSPSLTPSGGQIAGAAMQYEGGRYRWGGGGPFPTPGGDCSGFVSWVLGHDLGMTLPGGLKGFNGRSHGPVVLQYAAWSGAVKVKGTPQAGDLCIWAGPSAAGHIGIAISGTQMISALDQQQGVAISRIQGGGPPSPFMVRRVKGSAAGGSLSLMAQQQQAAAGGCLPLLVLLPLAPVAFPVLVFMRRRAARRVLLDGIEV